MPTPPPSIDQPEATTAAFGPHASGPHATPSEGSGDFIDPAPNGAVAPTVIDDPGQTVIDDPGQLIRFGVMLSKLNAEIKEVSLDDRTVDRLYELHSALLGALTDNLGFDLATELRELMPALDVDNRSAAQIRLAHLQLSGWLEGLFQGIQLSVAGHQLRAQLGALEAQTGEPGPQTSTAGASAYL